MVYVTERTISRITAVSKDSQSFRTIVPRSICVKLNLGLYDMLEWIDAGKNQVTVMKRQLK
jgi:hypothetical protein